MKLMRFKSPSVLLAVCLSLGLLAFVLVPGHALAQQTVVKGLPDFTELVEQVGPSVVNIRTLKKFATQPAVAVAWTKKPKNCFGGSLASQCLTRPMRPMPPDKRLVKAERPPLKRLNLGVSVQDLF